MNPIKGHGLMTESEKKRITLLYFALLQDQTGLDKETVSTAANTPKELYVELQAVHPLSMSIDVIRVAINDDLVAWDAPLRDGDRVVFLAPVSGG